MPAEPVRRILVAVDFGAASARALRVAGALASATGASLDALHAETLEAPPYFTPDQADALARQRENARASAERYLTRFAEQRGAAVARAIVADGPAYTAVLKLAPEVDLVVMGTHGRTGPSRWWMGSVAERVVRESPVPVLVVRAAASEEPGATVFQRLLVVGPSGEHVSHLRTYAAALAAPLGGEAVEGEGGVPDEVVSALGATMMVLPRLRERQWYGETFEHALRRCELPLLFVPELERSVS